MTATFTHVNATVQRLELAAENGDGEGVGAGAGPVAGAVEVLEPMAGHPLFSLTRGDWVEAGELVPGERLQTRSGVAQVLSVTASAGAQRVFNFEVEGEHEYLVGGLEVRSHNSCVPDAPKTKSPNRLGKEGETKDKASTGLDQNHEVFDNAKLVGPDGEVKVHLRGSEGSPDATKITPQLKEQFDNSDSPLKPVWDL